MPTSDVEVLRDAATFSSAGYDDSIGPIMGRTILAMDEPEHRAYRSLVQQAFSRGALESWETELVVPTDDRLIDGFAGKGRADLVSRLFFPFPVYVIAGMLISTAVDVDLARRASEALAGYLLPFIAARREAPGGDVISVLATAEQGGERLSDDEILAFCRLLLPAGAETTYRSSANLACGLLGTPGLLDRLRADRSLVPTAVLPRHAPGPHGDAGRDRAAARPPAGAPARPVGAAAGHHRADVPSPAAARGRLGLTRIPSWSWAPSRTAGTWSPRRTASGSTATGTCTSGAS